MHTDHCIIFLKGVQSLEEAAVKNGFPYYIHDQAHLRGYYLSPGVRFEKVDPARLQVTFVLHKDYMDDAVPWPFFYKVKLSVKHPVKDEACDIVAIPAPSPGVQKPVESNTRGVWYGSPSLKLHNLTCGGYVVDDQLRVKSELLL